jgi:hypothetical protein
LLVGCGRGGRIDDRVGSGQRLCQPQDPLLLDSAFLDLDERDVLEVTPASHAIETPCREGSV